MLGFRGSGLGGSKRPLELRSFLAPYIRCSLRKIPEENVQRCQLLGIVCVCSV